MVTVREELRKGPWTEQEDMQLVCTVRLFGDRRWDFIAQVSGLNRTGKSCRLRWVNYLHPDLKHGRMSPQEEHLIIELHARWGNRWSRIARRLPGRTDNEIKNYWRTHMRKKAQERKMSMSPSSSSSSLTYQSCLLDTAPIIGMGSGDTHNGSSCITSALEDTQSVIDGYPIDQIWREIEAPALLGIDEEKEKACSSLPCPLLPTAMWDYKCPEVFWKMEDEEIRMLAPQFGYGK
ncbi:myb-related protein MYBAS1-like isoform X2 [Phragmites australis]|uniref:myb-related protein MYBAS1-like isoform X2 n=1 Tax=Phragmites australis TaxID=29695 RepID=UPI002D776373|nr:myb-related protein MYBAS1-like isoform X2 [Phragmites australis]